MVRFVRASMKGWKYAIDHNDEAASIVMDGGGQDENHQKRIMCHQNHPSDKEEVYGNDPTWDRALFQLLFRRLWTKLSQFSAETQIVDRVGNKNPENGLPAEVRHHKWETPVPPSCHHDDRRRREMA